MHLVYLKFPYNNCCFTGAISKHCHFSRTHALLSTDDIATTTARVCALMHTTSASVSALMHTPSKRLSALMHRRVLSRSPVQMRSGNVINACVVALAVWLINRRKITTATIVVAMATYLALYPACLLFPLCICASAKSHRGNSVAALQVVHFMLTKNGIADCPVSLAHECTP